MGNGYLWLLSADGVPYRVTADSKIGHISDVEWRAEPVISAGEKIRVCQIAAAPHAAFALDSHGAVYQFVLSSHLTIRQKVEIYSNQRWYPVIGWSSRTLPTDRASFSNEDGSNCVQMTGFQLKSDGWRWEEPWIIDMDVRKHDKEGWEYATNFAGAVWKPENGVSTFVRRRRLKRHMRYTSLEKWAEVPRSNNGLIELAVGGFELLQEKQCLLFALSKDGILLRRVGIHANNPDGNYWQEIDGITGEEEREELSKICCSPSFGTLVALTWDGRMFVRIGITKDAPNGQSWSPLVTPGSHPVAFVSIGRNSLWTTSVDGKLWVKRLQCCQEYHDLSSFSTSNYSTIGEGIYGMCLNGKDQLVGMSDSGVIYIREGISAAEPGGRVFLRIVERTSESQKWLMVTNAGTNYTSSPKHWVNEHVIVVSASHYKDTQWRRQILNELSIINEAHWEAFKSMSNDLEDLMREETKGDPWSRKIRSKLRMSGERRFMAGMVHLSVDQMVFQSSTGTTVAKLLNLLTSAVCDYDIDASTFLIRASFSAESLELGFSEESERDEFHELLQQEPFANNGHPLSLCIPGHMKSVSAGAEGVVWSLAKDGAAYALSPDYSPFYGNVDNLALPQKTQILREIVEYQKHTFLRGFVAFQGKLNGISAWMEGGDSISGLYDKLPSREWSWVDREWKLIGEDRSEGGWAYSAIIDGEYNIEKKRKVPKYLRLIMNNSK